MGKSYKPITSMKEVPEQLRKLRRQYLRYQQAEIIYSTDDEILPVILLCTEMNSYLLQSTNCICLQKN